MTTKIDRRGALSLGVGVASMAFVRSRRGFANGDRSLLVDAHLACEGQMAKGVMRPLLLPIEARLERGFAEGKRLYCGGLDPVAAADYFLGKQASDPDGVEQIGSDLIGSSAIVDDIALPGHGTQTVCFVNEANKQRFAQGHGDTIVLAHGLCGWGLVAGPANAWKAGKESHQANPNQALGFAVETNGLRVVVLNLDKRGGDARAIGDKLERYMLEAIARLDAPGKPGWRQDDAGKLTMNRENDPITVRTI